MTNQMTNKKPTICSNCGNPHQPDTIHWFDPNKEGRCTISNERFSPVFDLVKEEPSQERRIGISQAAAVKLLRQVFGPIYYLSNESGFDGACADDYQEITDEELEKKE